MSKPVTVRVRPAHKAEIHKGWVRISEEERCGIANGRYIKLSHGEKSVFTQVRGTPNNEIDVARISEWYRKFLGLEESLSEKVGLKLRDQRQVYYWLRALMSHPDDASRLSIGLAFISIVLGFSGVGLAIGLSASSPAMCWSIIGLFVFIAVGVVFGIKIVKGPARPTNSN